MSVTPGQENPGQAFERRAAGFRAYMLNGDIITEDLNADIVFKMAWNNLDHANLVSVVLFQNQRFGVLNDVDGQDRWKNYRILIHTNTESEDATHYWMDDTTLLIEEGFSSDIPPGAHDYPMVIRDGAITAPQQLLAFLDVQWN